VAVTNYSERQHGDPDVEVQFTHEGQTVTGFIDARRQNDGIWEAWVWFSYDDNGWRATRKDWIPMDRLTLLSIDEVPASELPSSETDLGEHPQSHPRERRRGCPPGDSLWPLSTHDVPSKR